MNKKIILIVTLLSIFFSAATAQVVEVTISGIRNGKGQIVIGIFKDDPSFQKEEAYISKSFLKKDIINGEMKISFSLEPGIFGLTLLDDENSSGLMEYNFIGIPKEGFGFSDYYHSGLTKPKFDAFKFSLSPGQQKKVGIKIRYM